MQNKNDRIRSEEKSEDISQECAIVRVSQASKGKCVCHEQKAAIIMCRAPLEWRSTEQGRSGGLNGVVEDPVGLPGRGRGRLGYVAEVGRGT